MDWLQVILSFLGGGTIIGILTWTISNRKDKRQGLKEIIDLYKSDNDRLRKDVDDLKKEFEEYRKRSFARENENTSMIRELKVKLNLLESAHLDLPVPQWLKDTSGKMLSVNTAYCETFGISAENYVGKSDYDVWPKEIADAFMKNDEIVKRTRKHVMTKELAKTKDYEGYWRVLKYPRFEGRTLVGIGGIAFQEIETELTPART